MIKKKIMVIGGGTGSYVVLSGLKEYDYDIVAVTTVADDGGSSGRLRDEFGFLPAGDMRQSIAALSQENGFLKDLLLYRFEKGEKGLKGHNLGNLILTALDDITGSESKALETATKIFSLKGKVLPVSLDLTKVRAKYSSGKEIIGEHFIEENKLQKGERILEYSADPPVKINPAVKAEIKDTDLIIFGPGDLYNSTIANLTIKGVSEAIKGSQAKILHIINLMTLSSQTAYFTASDHVRELEKYLGKKVNYILLNTRKIPEDVLKNYRKFNEYQIEDDLRGDSRVFRLDLLSTTKVKKNSADPLKRSLIRHSSHKLGKAIVSIVSKI